MFDLQIKICKEDKGYIAIVESTGILFVPKGYGADPLDALSNLRSRCFNWRDEPAFYDKQWKDIQIALAWMGERGPTFKQRVSRAWKKFWGTL